MKCPNCGERNLFYITVECRQKTWYSDGASYLDYDDITDSEDEGFDFDAPCTCSNCNFQTELFKFDLEEE